jgi:hypothetical protein
MSNWASMFFNKTYCFNMVVLFSTMVEKILIHIKLFFFVLFFNFIWGERFFHWLFTTLILWSTIKIYLGLWITYNFFNFIGKNVHMFHHISIIMPPTIQCIIEGTFMTIITWNSICNIIIFLLFYPPIFFLFFTFFVFCHNFFFPWCSLLWNGNQFKNLL